MQAELKLYCQYVCSLRLGEVMLHSTMSSISSLFTQEVNAEQNSAGTEDPPGAKLPEASGLLEFRPALGAASGEATDEGEEGWRGEGVGLAVGTAVALLPLSLLSTTGASNSPPAVLFADDKPGELPAELPMVGGLAADGAGLTALLLSFPAALPGTD